jgi:hypothetical protein
MGVFDVVEVVPVFSTVSRSIAFSCLFWLLARQKSASLKSFLSQQHSHHFLRHNNTSFTAIIFNIFLESFSIMLLSRNTSNNIYKENAQCTTTHPTVPDCSTNSNGPARSTASNKSVRQNAEASKRIQICSGPADDANSATILPSEQEIQPEEDIMNTNCLSTTSSISLARPIDQRYVPQAPTFMGVPGEVRERIYKFLWPQHSEMTFCPCLEHGEVIRSNHRACATIITDAYEIANLSSLARVENARRMANLRQAVCTIIPTPLNNVSRQLYHDTDWRYTDLLNRFRDVHLTVCSPNCLHQIVSCATREQLARITEIKMEWWPLRAGGINNIESFARSYRQLHDMYFHFFAQARQTWAEQPGNAFTTFLHTAALNLLEMASGRNIERPIVITFAGAVLRDQPNPIVIKPGPFMNVPGFSCCVAH